MLNALLNFCVFVEIPTVRWPLLRRWPATSSIFSSFGAIREPKNQTRRFKKDMFTALAVGEQDCCGIFPQFPQGSHEGRQVSLCFTAWMNLRGEPHYAYQK